MKNIGIIIQARISSTRLPRKIILECDEKTTFLDILLTRLKNLNLNLPIVLATSNLPENDILELFADKYKIKFYRGSEENVLERFIDCAEQNRINTIVRICSDNPFIDISMLQNLINSYQNEDYLSYKINGTPSILTHFGFFAEIVSIDALQKVALEKKKTCIEHVTNCIYQNENHFNVKFLEKTIKNINIRCTLDTKLDFDNLKDIYLNYLKQDFDAEFSEIINYIETREDLQDNMKKIIIENKK